jgi:hypothetical protein
MFDVRSSLNKGHSSGRRLSQLCARLRHRTPHSMSFLVDRFLASNAKRPRSGSFDIQTASFVALTGPRLLGCMRPGRHGRGGSHGARIRSPRLARSRYQLPALQGAIGGAGGVDGQLALRIGRHGPGLEPSRSPPASPPAPSRPSPPPRPEIAGIVLPCRPPTGS